MAEATDVSIEVELIYALPHEQVAETLRIPVGTTVGQALAQSGILLRHPEITANPSAIGIFGRHVKTKQVLREFDRIEIYRPLLADPKQARRMRALGTEKLKR